MNDDHQKAKKNLISLYLTVKVRKEKEVNYIQITKGRKYKQRAIKTRRRGIDKLAIEYNCRIY